MLILGEDQKRELQRIKEYAEDHIVPLEKLNSLIKGQENPVGDSPEYTCHLPPCYKVVFSIEEQPGGQCRHVSMSITGDNIVRDSNLPNSRVVELVMKELGFKVPISKCFAWKEKFGEGTDEAVNVIEPTPEALIMMEEKGGTKIETFDLRKHHTTLVNQIQKIVPRDGVIYSTAFIVSPTYDIFGISTIYKCDHEKYIWFDTIHIIIDIEKAIHYTMIVDAWAVNIDLNDPEQAKFRDIRPSENPHRIEVINVLTISKDFNENIMTTIPYENNNGIYTFQDPSEEFKDGEVQGEMSSFFSGIESIDPDLVHEVTKRWKESKPNHQFKTIQ